MEKIMTYETLRSFTYSNDKLIRGKIRGIVVEFFGLGANYMYNQDPESAIRFAKEGILHVIPYNNPWCWMNDAAVRYTDEVIAVLCEKYCLGDDVKVVATGGSMGGLSALVYTRYAAITPVACVANCPVCDLSYHFTERPDLPRTLYSAFAHFDGTMDEALRSCSPLHLADGMPKIPYTIYHCEEDKAVNIDRHSVRFVEAMKKEHSVRFVRVPECGHCVLPPDVTEDFTQAILRVF